MKGGFSRKNKKGLGGALSGGLLGQLSQESGKTISNADRARLQAMARQDSGKSISDADRERIEHFLGRIESPRPKTDRQLMQFEDGGKVKKPKKYKGPLPKPKPKMTPIEKFTGKRSVNKSLSEEEKKYIGDKMAGKVVEKMKKGGAVRGMGRAYMGASRKAKIR
jgi:hypothetical protein